MPKKLRLIANGDNRATWCYAGPGNEPGRQGYREELWHPCVGQVHPLRWERPFEHGPPGRLGKLNTGKTGGPMLLPREGQS